MSAEKKELVEKARRLGREYLRKYGGCAPATLLAVADTLDLRVGDELFKAMTGFSSLAGVCGNVCGGIAAMGLRYGVGLEDFVKNPEIGSLSFAKLMTVAKVLREQFVGEYGGYLCNEVQTKLFGKCVMPTSPEELEAFNKMDPEELQGFYKKCGSVTENAAGWTVAAILEMDENR
ncbi:C-GCAxxG-C-C family (seleno)protein [Chloroflexota bacterium]